MSDSKSTSKLDTQIKMEKFELENAPTVSPGPPAGRCHFCGQLAREVEFVDVFHGVERMRGVECCGRRPHVQVQARKVENIHG